MYLPRLFRGRLWPDKLRLAYDKMIKKQPATRPALSRREDPTHVAFQHRLKFAFAPDDGPKLDAVHLRLVCAGERLSDWSGGAACTLGGTAARSLYTHLLKELSAVWADVTGAVGRGEHIGAPSSLLLTELLLNIVERRYARFALVLPAGRAREEILANVARQFGELRTYFAAFDASLADCASQVVYGQQAQWIGQKVLGLFAPAVTSILTADG
jgi:hypothetical protein